MDILENKKFVICDVDGTIFDRMLFYTVAFSRVCEPYGIKPEVSRAHYIQTAGDVIAEQFGSLLEKSGMNSPDEVKKCCELFWASAKHAPAPLFKGARETLIKLREKNKILFATSGSNEDELKELFAANSLPPFVMILGSDKIPKGEKHIRAFAASMNLPLEEFVLNAVLVGDGPSDMRIAKQCGILGIGVTTTTTAEILINAGASETISLLSEVI